MENHSMRRRQTVLGEQLQAAANSTHSLASTGNSQKGGSNPSLTVPGMGGGQHHHMGGGHGSGTSLGISGGPGGVRSHMRSFSRLSARYDNDSELSLDSRDPTSRSPLKGPRSMDGQRNDNSTQVNTSGTSLGGVSAGGSVSSTSNGGVIDLMDPALVNGPIDPLSYLSRNLAGADAAAVLAFGKKLRAQAQKASESEHRSVQRNYKALRAVASGVTELPVAIAELDRQIAELSAVTDAMRQDAAQSAASVATPGGGQGGVGGNGGTPGGGSAAGSGTPGGGRRSLGGESGADIDDLGESDPRSRLGVRQSMLVLNSTWLKDLNSLYQRVSGAQKVLPPAPGRHLVLEESGWLLLNLVTRKPVKPVLLVLLNDYFLVAAPQHGRYVYHSHFALEERISSDIDETGRVLQVKSGDNAQLVLQAPSLSRLLAVYHELTKLNELAVVSKQRLATRSRARASGSYESQIHSTVNDVALGNTRRHTRTQSNNGHGHSRKISTSSVSSAQEATIEERREASKVVANIDREIAHRKWAAAVELVVMHSKDPVYGAAVNARHQDLTSTLLSELTNSWRRNSREESSNLIKLLVALGNENQAKTTLLETAANDIEQQSRAVNFMGDVVSYISQMAAIYFQSIIATLKVYQLAFPSKADSSRITAWVKSQVDLYAAIFNRQLFRIAPEFKAYQRCREVSRLESSQLKAHRMDMEFMLRYVWEN